MRYPQLLRQQQQQGQHNMGSGLAQFHKSGSSNKAGRKAAGYAYFMGSTVSRLQNYSLVRLLVPLVPFR